MTTHKLPKLAKFGFTNFCQDWSLNIPLPKGKIEAFCNLLRSSLWTKALPARSLASIVGKIISMSIALDPVTRLMTRGLYAVINTHDSWCDTLLISLEAEKELRFWLEQTESFNG